ncbi:single-strand selective monofunctional uracil DNA glycosylase [Parasteatoda tepidariorum]|uniref:single-strand selective monofunctional uracil DNA glycosylase n=1 Tax=Parasteatoda tepidariorum TaxID=114398 RepID=UPI00077FA06A|nr:single-strand selective monofunctional uracil DNA glycosylase [Parasteatoda tepidariorum]
MCSCYVSETLLEIEKRQCNALSAISFNEKVCYVYNPLEYAKETHEYYVRTFCPNSKLILFLGMNPGPFGMAQNGVPFGDSFYVNNWLKIKGNVSKPKKEHPKRQIHGLSCPRSEVSGQRFWSYLAETCKTPEKFFQHCYVHNYCPISMMTATAKNITPPELKANEKKLLLDICDESLIQIINLLGVKCIVGIGKFAEDRVKKVLKTHAITNIAVIGIMHPSPINPAANKGWKNIVHQQLENSGVLKYLL